ncbi:hypothetical protein PENSPDRAFT_694942 [Peniophora sp. CONT]|nr:hypothetical protein PENSPDRAFT_694942 [Peniophora sp. CONT]
MPRNNLLGKNGHDNGTRPSDDVLRDVLHDYSKQGLSLDVRLRKLKKDFGYDIKRTTLKALNKEFNVPSSRKGPKGQAAAQLVVDEMTLDPAGLRGPVAIQERLRLKGQPVPRDCIRKVMHAVDPDGPDRRFPGKKVDPIHRNPLHTLGPMLEVHCDGHEKLGALALRMDGVGLPIYGFKDKWSSYLLSLTVIPNDRDPTTIAHLYCDLVETYGCIPLQITADKGTETPDLYAMQNGWRDIYAPNINPDEWPAFQALKSVHNTPIEGLWNFLQKNTGVNLKEVITRGKTEGIYHVGDDNHRQLFYWIWPKVVQDELDVYREYWNMHTIRPQKQKVMPSGDSPNQFWTEPEEYNGQRLTIPVPNIAVRAMRADLLKTREEVMTWPTTVEFDTVAQDVYETLGSPKITKENGWELFRKMMPRIRESLGQT